MLFQVVLANLASFFALNVVLLCKNCHFCHLCDYSALEYLKKKKKPTARIAAAAHSVFVEESLGERWAKIKCICRS